MEESEQFVADVLGDYNEPTEELATPTEDSVESEEQEVSQPLEQTNPEQQENETETETEKPEPRYNRIHKRIQQLSSKLQESSYDPREILGNEPTHEQLQEMVRREAQNLYEEQEIARLQDEYVETWTEDLESLIDANPALQPDNAQYNKRLDEFLTSLITDADGEPNVNFPIADVYSQLQLLLGDQQNAKQVKAKKQVESHYDEYSVGDGSRADVQKAKKSFDDLDSNDPVAFLRAIERGEV